MTELSPPPEKGQSLIVEPLGSSHDRAAFSCGVSELDNYLKRQASQDHTRNLARTFVLIPTRGSREIMGYYSLSGYSLTFDALPPELSRKLPHSIPLPATLLGRLALREDLRGHGLGRLLLLYAMREVVRATRSVASLGLVVDAMTDELVAYYESNGFVPLMDRPRHLIAPITRMRAMFPEASSQSLDLDAMVRPQEESSS